MDFVHDPVIEVIYFYGTQQSMCLSSPHLKTETDPLSETLFSRHLEYRTMDEVHKPSYSEYYTPS
jgi:hypothetical protein